MNETLTSLRRRIDRAAYDLENSLAALEVAQHDQDKAAQEIAVLAIHVRLRNMYLVLAEVEQLEALK